MDEPRRLVEHRDVHGLRVEDLPDPLADRVVDRLRLELAGDRVLDAVDQRELRIPLPRLVHQPRVLERHAQASGERRPAAAGRDFAEGVLAVDVLERDHAGRLAARRRAGRRDPTSVPRRPRSRCRSARPRRPCPPSISSGSRVSSTCLENPSGERGSASSRSPRSIEYGKCTSPVASSSADRDALRVEDLTDPVADGVVDRLHLEFARERVLHAVDQRQLGVPLPRLVHEPRVLQRHAQAARERRQQPRRRSR